MPKNEKGITMLELLVALVIAVFLGGAIFNVFNLAVRSWQKGEARTQVYQNLRIALDRMSEEIRSAIALDPDHYPSGTDVYFYGQSDRLDFISVAHPPIGNYYNSDWTDPANPQLVFDCCEIGYKVSGTTLYRRKKEKNVPDGNVTEGGTEKELAPYITNLSFQYSPDVVANLGPTWDAETKTPPGKLPKLVEISVTATSAVKRYPNEKTLTTYVYLP